MESRGEFLIVSDFELRVEKLVYGGEGLGRLDGRVALVPFVLPGERVRARAEQHKPGLVRGRLIEILEAAPERVAPPCPYFGRCGGCHYQHAPYPQQLEIKRAVLAETLRRIGKLEPPAEIAIVAGEPWHYRNRTQFHFQGAELGYREAHSHRLCAIAECPISSPRINQIIGTLSEMLHDARWPHFLRSMEVFTNEATVQFHVLESDRPVARRFFDWAAERIPELAEGAIEYPAAGHLYRVSRSSFFQVNRFLTDRLVEAVLEGAQGAGALDLYAGVGLFSLPLAARCGEVTAVESAASAVADLRFNAERAGLPVAAVAASADEFLAKLEAAPDFVLLDPPRAGLGPAVVRHLARLQARQITIVACDPATLARDLAGLVAAGYQLERLTMADLFPQTFHIESVARLRRV